MGTLNSYLTSMGRIRDDEILRVVMFMVSGFATQPENSIGVQIVFPGSCAMIADVDQTYSKAQF